MFLDRLDSHLNRVNESVQQDRLDNHLLINIIKINKNE